MTRDKIAIIGPYPPPYGGISVHIQRVLKCLPSGSFVFYNSGNTKIPGSIRLYGKIKYLKVLLFLFRKYKLVHTHTTDNILRILFGLIGFFRRNIYLHLHGASMSDFIAKPGFDSWLMKQLIPNLHIIADNQTIANEIRFYQPRTIYEIDAFIPASWDPAVYANIMRPYRSFFSNGRFVVSMTGWFDRYHDEDLYGFDLVIGVLKKFIDEGKPIYLVASINGIRNDQIHRSFTDFIQGNSLRDHVLLIYDDLPEVWPIFMASDVFLRPTNTDGSAVSIKEALWVETPVIASDCVIRPEDVTLFRNRQMNDLYEKLLYFYNGERRKVEWKIERVKKKKFIYPLIQEVYEL